MTAKGKAWNLKNEEFVSIILESSSYSDARFRIYGVHGNAKGVKDRCSEMGLDTSHFQKSAKRSKVWTIDRDEFARMVAESRSFNQVVMKIFKHPCNVRTVKLRIKHDNLDISHFTGKSWSKGKKLSGNKIYDDREIFVKNCHVKIPGQRLKKRLLKSGFFKKR